MKSLIALMLALIPGQDGRGGKIDWSSDVEGGFKRARETGRPVMIYFTHDD